MTLYAAIFVSLSVQRYMQKKQNWGNVRWENIRPLANKSICACCFSKNVQSFSNFSKHSKIKINIHTVFKILVVAEYTDRICVFLQRVAQNRHHKGISIVVVPKKHGIQKHKIYCCSTHPPTKNIQSHTNTKQPWAQLGFFSYY